MCWCCNTTSQAIKVIVWSLKRQKKTDLRLDSWNFFIFCFPACSSNQHVQSIAHISRITAPTDQNASPRCVPLVDAVMRMCLVSSNPTYLLFEGPKVKWYASCWNQFVFLCIPPHSASFRVQTRPSLAWIGRASIFSVVTAPYQHLPASVASYMGGVNTVLRCHNSVDTPIINTPPCVFSGWMSSRAALGPTYAPMRSYVCQVHIWRVGA